MFRKSVTELDRQASMVGMVFGQVYLAEISEEDRDDFIWNDGVRSELRKAYTSAAADVGDQKAMKIAIRAARAKADAMIYVARNDDRAPYGRYRHVLEAVEQVVRQILAEEPPERQH